MDAIDLPLFVPPRAAASLYVGSVMHARLKPFAHRFAYRVFSILVDLDRLDEANRLSPIFSVGRFNLMSFHPADHGDGGTDLRAHVDAQLAEAGMAQRTARILLSCYPRVLGAVFNPLSVYYAYDGGDALVAVVYEVRNTFGERHAYVAPVRAGELSAAGLRQTRRKLFHVSPFIDMDQQYRFRLLPPGERLGLRILESDAEGALLSATYGAVRRPLTTRTLLAAFLSRPALPVKVLGGIHWQALKLWLKGATFHARPSPPPTSSLGDRAASVAVRTCPLPKT